MSSAEITGLVLAGLVMLAGLIGTLIPGVPGAPLILAAAIGHKIYFGSESIGYVALAGLVILTILSMVLDFLGSLFGAKKMGATWRGMLGAIVGAIVGIFFSLPGLILGPIIGAFLFELVSGRAWREAARAGAGAFIGMILGAVGRVVCCVLMIVVFSAGVLWNHNSAQTAAGAAKSVARNP